MSDDKNISKEEQHHDILGKSRNERVSLGLTMAIYALIGVFALYLVADLYKTTVIDYDIYARAASDQQWRMMSYAADRGVIYDANNMPVASNTYNYTVVISPKVLMSSDELEDGTLSREQLINDMAALFEMAPEDIDEVLPYDPEDSTDPRNDVAGMDLIRNLDAELAEPAKTYCQLILEDNESTRPVVEGCSVLICVIQSRDFVGKGPSDSGQGDDRPCDRNTLVCECGPFGSG